MNTRKQVLLMTVLLLAMLVILGIYGAWYPYREDDAAEYFATQTAERGSILFARNCRLCHGDVGQGGALGGRLAAAPALNRADLQGFVDSKSTLAASANSRGTELTVSDVKPFKAGQTITIDQERIRVKGVDGNKLIVERGVDHSTAASHADKSPVLLLDPAALKDKIKMLTNTITCGRVGTAMPAWSQVQGGPLSDEQIRQLMVLITENRWDLVAEEVDVEDEVLAHLTDDLPANDTVMFVSDVTQFTEKDAIRIGDERLRLVSVPNKKDEKDKSGVIIVERGIRGTTPLDHSEEDEIFKFPEVAAPSINETSCGQTARPAVPAAPPGLIEPFTGQTVEIIAQGVQFNLRDLRVSKAASQQVRVRLDNKDAGVDHNIAFYASATSTSAPLIAGSIGTIFAGPAVDDTVFDIPNPGSYFFRCDVHPTTMTGTFTVAP